MAQIDIVGILDDGSTPNPSLPQNTVKTVNLAQYEDLIINLSVFYPSGIPVPLASIGAVLIFTVNKNSANGIPPFISNGGAYAPLVGPNNATFHVLPAETAPTAPGYVGIGRYVCDVWLLAGGKNYHIWGLSQFSLNPSVWTPNQPITPPTPSSIQTLGLPSLTGVPQGYVLTVDPVNTLAWDSLDQYALLDGRLGGQTLIGGISASDGLTLQATSNVADGSIHLKTSQTHELGQIAYSSAFGGAELTVPGNSGSFISGADTPGASTGSLFIGANDRLGPFTGIELSDTGSNWENFGNATIATGLGGTQSGINLAVSGPASVTAAHAGIFCNIGIGSAYAFPDALVRIQNNSADKFRIFADGSVMANGFVSLLEIATPLMDPSVGFTRLYFNSSDHKLHFVDAGGTDHTVTST